MQKKIFLVFSFLFSLFYVRSQCNHVFNMYDSWGDGWNGGASVDLVVNGVTVISGATLSSGSAGSMNFNASSGDLIELANWNGGSYPSEISWDVQDGSGSVIASGVVGDNTVGNGNCPSCIPPFNLNYTNITSLGSDISWTAGGNETMWNLEYGATGFTQGSGSYLISGVSSPYSITGLTANTSYDVYLQADCGSGITSSWTGPYMFTTLCDAILNFPYNIDFESGLGCWTSEDIDGGNSWQLFSGAGNGGSSYAAGIIYNATAHDDYLISPKFQVTTGSSDRFSFMAQDYGGYGETFDVMVSTSGFSAADFTITLASAVTPSSSYSYYEYDLSAYSGQDIYVSIKATGTNGYYLFIDDVTIDQIPSCSDPSGLLVSNVTSSGADVSWISGGGETEWNIDYGIVGYTPGSGTTITTNPYTLTGLSSATSYDVYIQAKCGSGDVSSWVGPVLLSTPGSCGTFSVELNDSYGDGWNGGSLDVFLNGSSFITGATIVSGTGPEVYSIPVNIGDIIDFIYTPGSYPGENSYKVYDQNNMLLFEEGSGSLIPVSVSGISACPSCPDPSGLLVSNVTSSGADVSWISGGSETEWNVEYGATGFVQGSGLLTSTTVTSFILNGLNENTCYDFYLQSDCGNGNKSQWIGPYSFITNIENGCLHSLNLYDSFGDGWSGSSVDLLLNGLTIINGATVSSGFLNNISFLASSGSNISLNNWVTGSWTSELSWDITDVNGTIISSGSFGDLGFGLGNCCPIITATDLQVACDSLTWIDGITYTSSNNTATHILTNAAGCDSVVTLDLMINYSKSGTDTQIACDSYTWSGNIYDSTGYYVDTLQSLNGCDSIVTLDLTINNSSSTLFTVISCHDYLWNGNLYTNSGFYFDTLQSINGCDSIVTLSLIIKEATVDTIIANSCDFYSWRGNIYNQSGIYRDTLQSILGCDSILLLDLTLGNSSFTNDSVTSCQNYLWNGNTYNLPGIYTNTLTSLEGCDSVVTLYLTIINSVQGDTLSVSECDEFIWQGYQYNQTGVFSDTLLTNSGCDSIIYLNLTVNGNYEIDEYVNACTSYNWNGITYSLSGEYIDTLLTSSGCDSIVNLNLTIFSYQIFSDTILSCESYIWNGFYLDSTGLYRDTLQTIGGCDSILILDLTVYENAFANDSVSTCEFYDWNGVRYTSSGVYVDTFQTSNGCDSIVSLSLNLFPVYQDTIFASACDSFVWYGNTYTSAGIYTNSFSTIKGCDSVEVLNFSLNNDNNTSPIDFELVLDNFCLETHWNIVSSDGIVVHQEGPYDCNINGFGLQSNQTINRSLSLEQQDCYTFTLYDDFGDGLGASQWGGTDGSWLLNDLNGNSLFQGQGNFGDSVSVSFYINEDFSTSIIESENNFSEIIAYPNPFIGETEIKLINFEGLYDVSIRDIQGKIVHKLYNLSNNHFTLRSSIISRGVYWVVLDNHPTIKPLKLIVQ